MISKFDWSKYRKRRLQFIFALLGTIGLVLIIGSEEELPFFAPPLIWFGWMIIVLGPLAFRFGLCPCPCCKKNIHFKNGFGYLFSPRCLHCRCEIGAESIEKETE